MQGQPISGKLRIFFPTGAREYTLPITPNIPFVIGRGRDVQLQLPNAPEFSYISNRHCHVIMSNGVYYIADGLPGGKPSAHGTFVNGQRIDQNYRFLQVNDEIMLGYGPNSVRLQFFVTPVSTGSRVPEYGVVDDRPTHPQIAPSFPGSFQPAPMPSPMPMPGGWDSAGPRTPTPAPEVDSYGMPISRSYSSGSGATGQLPGTAIARAIKRGIGGFLTTALLGTIFYAAGMVLIFEYLFSSSHEYFEDDRFVMAALSAGTTLIAWYAICCGLSACFPQLSFKVFSGLITSMATVAALGLIIIPIEEYLRLGLSFGNFFTEIKEELFAWGVRAVYAAVIVSSLSPLNRGIAPNDKPKLRWEFVLLLFAALIAADYLIGQELYNEYIWEPVDISDSDMRIRFGLVGALYGVVLSGLIWGALKASEVSGHARQPASGIQYR